MPYCPQCGFEYRQGIEVCADCGVALTDEPPREVEYTKEPLAVVYEADDQMMSQNVKEALEAAGIPAIEQVHRTVAYDNVDFSMKGKYSRLLCVESRAEEAKEVVAEYLRHLEAGELDLE